MSRSSVRRDNCFGRCPQSSARPISDHRVADLAGYGKSNANFTLFKGGGVRYWLSGVAIQRLEDKTRGRPFAPCAGDMKKFAPPLKSLRRWRHISGRQPLATFGAPAREDATAADRRFARPKAVAALANEYAGLIGAFHD